MWNFKPAPSVDELKKEYALAQHLSHRGDNDVDAGDKYLLLPRTRVIRRMLEGFDFVLRRKPGNSACKQALEELQHGWDEK